MKLELYQMLQDEALTDKSKAILSLKLLSEHPAGIGDHSTEDYYKNAQEALKKLASADERLEILAKYFSPDKSILNG